MRPLSDTARQLLYIILLVPSWRTPEQAAQALADQPANPRAHYKRASRALITLARRGLIDARPTGRESGAALEYNRPRDGAALAASALTWMREAARALDELSLSEVPEAAAIISAGFKQIMR